MRDGVLIVVSGIAQNNALCLVVHLLMDDG
jgi:hypothetical protein